MCCCECGSGGSLSSKSNEESEDGDAGESIEVPKADNEGDHISDENEDEDENGERKHGFKQLEGKHKNPWPSKNSETQRKLIKPQAVIETSKVKKSNPKNGKTSEIRITKTVTKSKVAPKSSSNEMDYTEDLVKDSPELKETENLNVVDIKGKEII